MKLEFTSHMRLDNLFFFTISRVWSWQLACEKTYTRVDKGCLFIEPVLNHDCIKSGTQRLKNDPAHFLFKSVKHKIAFYLNKHQNKCSRIEQQRCNTSYMIGDWAIAIYVRDFYLQFNIFTVKMKLDKIAFSISLVLWEKTEKCRKQLFLFFIQ